MMGRMMNWKGFEGSSHDLMEVLLSQHLLRGTLEIHENPQPSVEAGIRTKNLYPFLYWRET
jgi:hypothetical protein